MVLQKIIEEDHNKGFLCPILLMVLVGLLEESWRKSGRGLFF